MGKGGGEERMLINTIYLIHFNIVSNLSIPENSLLNGETLNFFFSFVHFFALFDTFVRKEKNNPSKKKLFTSE